MNRPLALALFSLSAGLLSTTSVAQSTAPAVFVTNNVSDTVTSLTINADGSLALVGTFTAGEGPQSISLSPNGQFLAVGHGTISSTTEELRIFEVNGDATLTPRLTDLVPDSPLDVQWLNDTVLAVVETDFSASNVRTFDFDDISNALTQIDIQQTGGFTSRVASSADGMRLFANDTFGNDSITSLSVDAAGNMSLVETQLTGSLFAVNMGLARDASFLYGAGGISGGGNAILGYSVDAAGMLDPLPGSPFASPGASPKVIAITGDDEILVAGHGTDATFWSFMRDKTSGALTATTNSFDVGGQGTLADLQIMDDLLFVTDSSTAIDGAAGIYSFRVNADGSFTQLGPIVDTQGVRPEYIATWRGLRACDFDLDTDCDIDDLNLLMAEGPIADGVTTQPGINDQFDLDGNGVIDLADRDEWLAGAADENALGSPYKLGDANLDGMVDGEDFLAWNAAKFTTTLRWDQGNFNGDPLTDGADFLLWNTNKFTSSDLMSAVPEPGAGSMMIFSLMLTLLASRDRINRRPSGWIAFP